MYELCEVYHEGNWESIGIFKKPENAMTYAELDTSGTVEWATSPNSKVFTGKTTNRNKVWKVRPRKFMDNLVERR